MAYGIGRDEKLFVMEEVNYGDVIVPTAPDQVKMLSSALTFAQERADRIDKRCTRSMLERYTKRITSEWTASGYLLPYGAAGSKPNLNLLYKHGFGVETVTPATSVAYSLIRDRPVGIVGLNLLRSSFLLLALHKKYGLSILYSPFSLSFLISSSNLSILLCWL